MDKITIELKLMDECNQYCSHCMNSDSPGGGKVVDTALFTRRIAQFASGKTNGFALGGVRITGGEPLLYAHKVKEIGRACRKHGISCGVNTNGALLTETLAKELSDAGVQLVKISLDSAEKEIMEEFRGAGTSVAETISGMRNAKRAGLRLLVRFTLSRTTMGQIIPCYELAAEYGAEVFQVKPLIKRGRAVRSGSFLTPEEIDQSLVKLRKEERTGGPSVKVLCWPGKLSGGLDTTKCASSDKIYVDTDLRVGICNYVPNAAVVGDLNEDGLDRIFARRLNQLQKLPGGGFIVKSCPQVRFFIDAADSSSRPDAASRPFPRQISCKPPVAPLPEAPSHS